MTFRIGQKVVCIKRDEWRQSSVVVPGPAYGDVVTIRGFDSHPLRGLFLHEWRLDKCEYPDGSEPGFAQEWFRPLVERKTDISVFKALLYPKNHEENV